MSPGCLLMVAACWTSAARAAGPVVPQAPASTVELRLPDAASLSTNEQLNALRAESQQLVSDARRQQAQVAELRKRLAAAESANGWLPWLFLSLVGSASAALWFGLRLSKLQRDQDQRAWTRAAADMSAALRPDAPSSGAAPLLAPEQRLLSGSSVLQTAVPATVTPPAPGRPPAAAPLAEDPMVTAGRSLSLGSGVPPRPVSVEEMLDLDQQVDFFVVLGQEQAAIDLLLGHVRATGGTSALPYFKLLEIYRRQGDEEAYERTRERFNLRFNAVAPDWQGDLSAGRHLEAYPEVVRRLQRAWPNPLRAVAELESLLLRRADLEPFDMPAFHDILTLHALVRDMPAVLASSAAPPADTEAPALVPVVPPVPATAYRPIERPTERPMERPAEPSPQRLVEHPRGRPLERPVEPLAPFDHHAEVDLLLPLDDLRVQSQGRPRLTEPGAARALLADWVFTRSVSRDSTATGASGRGPSSRPAKLDLDLSDFAPAPREFTRPAAFTDIDMRRDSRLSDLAPFDDSDLLPPPSRP